MSVDSGCNAMCSSKPLNVVKVGRLGLVERRGLEQTFIQPAVFLRNANLLNWRHRACSSYEKYTMGSRLAQWRTVICVVLYVYDDV